MIKKLFFRQLLTVAALAGSCGIAAAQNFVISTGVVNGSVQRTPPYEYQTFEVQNDNLCPIKIRTVSVLHIVQTDLTTPNPPNPPTVVVRNFTNQGANYTLYSSISRLAGSPMPINDGWTLEARRPNYTPVGANGIYPVFEGLEIIVPPQSRMRFIVDAADTIAYGAGNPGAVSSNGVTLIGSSQWYGQIPLNTGLQQSGAVFCGGISAEIIPPAIAVDPRSKPIVGCIGGSVTLRATSTTPGAIFSWRDPNGQPVGTPDATGRLVLNNLQLSQAGRYYVTAFSAAPGGCNKESIADSATLIINPPPAPTVAGKFNYCLNDQFVPVTVNGTNPQWYYDPVGGSPVPVTPTISTATPNTLTYYVSQTDQFGCESQERTMVRFRTAPTPDAPIVNTPVYYCENVPADELTAIGDTLRWYYFPAGGVATTIAPTPNTSVQDSLQYYVSQTVDGCESERSRIDVVVTFRPNGMIGLDRENICAEDTVIVGYFGSASPESQYNWSLPYPGGVLLGDADQDTLYVRMDTAGIYKFKLRVGHKGCQSEEYTKEIQVRPLPYGKISSPSDACLSQPILIEAIGYTPKTDTMHWEWDGGLTQHYTTEQGPYGVYWQTPGDKIVKVTFVNQGCSDFVLDTVRVHPKPSAKIVAQYDKYDDGMKRMNYVNYNGEEMCSNDSLKVTVAMPEPGAKYNWTPARYFDKYTDVPVTYAKVPRDGYIYVDVEDIYGCRNNDSLKVDTKVCCDIFYPSAFTPNNDGKNDRFKPLTLSVNEIESFRIVNRLGQTVYESKEIHTGWDGTFRGQPADMGTYFYMLSFICEENQKVHQGGEVILVR